MKGKRSTIKGQLIYDRNNFLLYRFAPRRTTKIENEYFEEEQYEDWPSIIIAIWNDKDKQIIAIQDRKKAFSSTKSVLKTIINSLNIALVEKQLKVLAEPIFNKEAFWKIIKQYNNKIKNIRFELITPNMANISKALSDDLKNLAKDTNTSKTKIEIDAEDSLLFINENNKQISSLVDYASEGGGNISIKASNVQKRIQTANSIKSIDIGEIELHGDNAENIASILRSILE